MKPLGDPSDLRVMQELAVRANRHGVEIDVTTNHERRALVLKHPDLAQRLCEKPMGYQRPEQWSGYIAPEYLQTGALNTSPYRAQVVEIYTEALAREGVTS